MHLFFPVKMNLFRCAAFVLSLLFTLPGVAITFDITGVEQDTIKNNIRMHLHNLDVEASLVTEPFWQDEMKAAVAKAVEPFGYYNATTEILSTENDNIQLAVSLNTPLMIANVTREIIGEGRDDAAFRAKFNAFSLKKGDVLNQPVYESFKSAMFNYALSNGYFDYFWQATRLDLVREEREANILLIAQSGPRYQFGELRIVGEDKAQAIIERLKPFTTGEPYTSAKLTAFNRELNQSGYFNRVIARPVVSEANGRLVPIEVSVQHRPRDTFDVGLGVATDTGPRIRLGWERPWVNARGHSMDADLFLSAPEQSVAFDYRIPMKNITHDYLSFQAGYQFVEYRNTQTESETLSLSAHRFWQQDDSPWQQDASLTFLREDYIQGLNPRTTTTLIMPGYGISYRQKDAELNINNGEYIALLAQIGRNNLGSDINIVKTTAEARLIRTYDRVHRVFVRGEIGAIKTNDFDLVPASIRFFAGGDRSIRGFAFRDISPKETIVNPVTGETSLDPIGGKYLATASIEYAYQFADKWRAATFFDAGTASNDINADFTYGVGGGVHWLSPIGPVRIYIARGFAAEGDNTWRLHLLLGPEIL